MKLLFRNQCAVSSEEESWQLAVGNLQTAHCKLPTFFYAATFFFILHFTFYISSAQYNQWTWMNGALSGTAVYGTMGVPDSANTPGSVYEATEWTDHNAIFWLLKGQNFWRYDPANNMWTWMNSAATNYGTQGIPSVNNYPGALSYAVSTWTDINNDLWLYGGLSGGNFSGNLWKYNIASAMWTWMKGPGTCACFLGVYGTKGVAAATNNPPGKAESSCTWVDAAGNLWLFGGQTPSNCSCSSWSGTTVGWSDLWKFDIGTNNWTWMSGPNIPSQPAVYGTKGTPSTNNTPGGRWAYASGKQINGDFMFFGGAFNGSTSSLKNDLWRYNPTTDEWTWLSGLSTNNDPGTFGTKCIPDTSNIPRSSIETRSRWTDDCGNLWLIGSSVGNALWRYSVANNTWTWVTGSNTTFQSAVHGTMGISDTANTPGMVSGASPWKTDSDFFLLSDVFWRYKPDKPTAAFTVQSIPPCAGLPAIVNFINTSTPGCNEIKSYLWNFGDPASGANNASTTANPSHIFNSSGTYTVQLKVINCTGSKDSAIATINIPAAISASTTSTAATCGNSNGSATVTAIGGTSPYTYNWSPSSQTTSTIGGLSVGTYSVTVTDGLGCTVTAQVTVICTTGISAIFTSSDTVFCNENGECINFFDHSTGNPTSWQWHFTGANPDTSSQQNPTSICYTTPGTYPVTLIVSSGSISDTLTVGSLIIFSSPPSPPVITVISPDTLISSSGALYQWYFNGSPIGGATDSSYVATINGTYAVMITDGFGCHALSNGTFISITAIGDSNGIDVKIFPNPANTWFMIYGTILGGETMLEIYNVLGEKVYSSPLETANRKQETIEVSTFSNGVYMLQLQSKYGVINKKFTVVH